MACGIGGNCATRQCQIQCSKQGGCKKVCGNKAQNTAPQAAPQQAKAGGEQKQPDTIQLIQMIVQALAGVLEKQPQGAA